MGTALWAVWAVGWLLVAWWCLRAARDYRDDEPQPGACDEWAAAWEHRLALPAYDPNHRTTKGN